MTDLAAPIRRPWRWHILVFLAPALIVYSALMIIPLAETLRLSLFTSKEQVVSFVGFDNFAILFGDRALVEELLERALEQHLSSS